MSLFILEPRQAISQTPIVPNGSFEVYNPQYLPVLNSTYKDFSNALYDWCWINRTIGCTDGYGVGQQEISHPNSPDPCFGWYIPSYGSADYYNRNAALTSIHIKVPAIQLYTLDPPDGIVEYREPFGYPTDSIAYCGIGMYNPDSTSVGAYREYIQTRLNSPLEANHTYRVSFRTSTAKHCTLALHPNGYVHSMGAYLSNGPTLNFNEEGYLNYYNWLGPLYDPLSYHEPICDFVVPQISCSTLTGVYANQSGPNRGLGAWQLVAGEISVPTGVSYNYITIGYFNPTMSDFVWTAGAQQTFPKTAYYFIDSVVIEEIPCLCPENSDDWLKVAVQKDSNCAGCLVTIASLNIPENYSCYTHYFVEFSQTMTPVRSLATNPIVGTSYCIGYNNNTDLKIYLLKGSSDPLDSACVITKHIFCDSTKFDPQDTTVHSCAIDCPENEWVSPLEPGIFTLPGGCQVRVSFKHRSGCEPNNFQDIMIYKIETITTCYPMPEQDIFREATKKLIEYNPMGFYPTRTDTGCSDQWRITIRSCWKVDIYWDFLTGLTTVMHPCDDSACCLQRYRVCRNPFSIDTIGTTSVSGTPGCVELPAWTPISDTTTCNTSCGWLRIDIFNPISRSAIANSEAESLELESVIKRLQITNEEKLKLEIYTVWGYPVYTKEFQGLDALNNLNVSSMVNNSGLYLYRIYINGLIIKTGKFAK